MTEVLEKVKTAAVCLWLPRQTMPSRRNAGAILDLLLRKAGEGDIVEVLRRAGHPIEAALLSDEKRVAEAEGLIQEGKVLTALDDAYPEAWRGLRSAPLVLWRKGNGGAAKWIAGVGSRRIDARTSLFCREVGAQAARMGFGLVSGAAEGCDLAALEGARRAGASTLALLPRGLTDDEPPAADVLLSARPWAEPFSTASAMERNSLIYAASEIGFVGHARLREGGSWHGATDALRRRLCPLVVPPVGVEPGLRALSALGATVIEHPSDLETAIRASQESLF